MTAMLKILQSLALSRKFVRRALALAFALSLFSLSSSLLYANDLYDAIEVTGGTKEQKGEDVIVTFTGPETAGAESTMGSIAIPKGSATARVLVVGGGGGGGSVTSGSYYGGAGGGGGGGVIDQLLSDRFKGTYSITVGAGGTAATSKVVQSGGNGGDSIITTAKGVEIARAVGGGGGAACSGSSNVAGSDGGSGGGGSRGSSGVARGGKGTTGQGNSGGAGAVKLSGGGGGGAGGEGVAPAKQGAYGKGGDGVLSDIRDLADDYFGGGGGGGIAHNTGGDAASKGLGGGGIGGNGKVTESRNGENGRGGGGGGSGGSTTFQLPGVGGSGIVIIRLSSYQEGGVPIPEFTEFTYDGEEKVVAQSTDLYTVTGGDAKATNVDDYEVELTLTAQGKGIGWDDGHPSDSRTIFWKILKRKVDTPAPTKTGPFVFDGTVQTGYVEKPDLYTFENNQKRDAGNYAPTATLVDPANNEWADGTATPARTLSWTIEKLLLPEPTPFAAEHTYDGTVQTGFVANAWYDYDDKNEQTNAGEYPVAVTLKEPQNATWAGAAPTLIWEIKKQNVKKPVVTSLFQFDNTEKVACEQPEADIGKYTLTGEKATNAGTYSVVAKLNNAAAENYKWQNGNTEDFTESWTIAVREIAWPPAGAQKQYPYEKGTTREPIPASDFYDRGETLSAEKAGDYATTADLKFNNLPTVTNVAWKLENGSLSAAQQRFEWAIVAQKVPVPQPKNFTFDGEAHVELEIPADALYQRAEGDDLTQTDAGSYDCLLALKDPDNTVWDLGDGTTSSEPQMLAWTIEKADNEVLALSVPDWQVGDTTPRSPVCSMKFGAPQASWYFWSSSEEGPWTVWNWQEKSVPTEAGTYYVKVDAPATKNWNATNRVESFCVWVHPSEVFTDFVDITLTSATTGKDKTVAVKVAPAVKDASGAVTGGLPGFEYMRTGLGGSEIRFIQADGSNMLKDKLLPYTLADWNPSGESTIHVKVADLAATTTIRMYWHAKDGDPKSANHPEDVTAAPSAATAAFSLVSRDGQLVDYWTEMPSITKSVWNVETPPTEADVKHGALKAGQVATYYLAMPVGATNTVIQTAPGTYAIVFARQGHDPAYTIFEGEKRVGYEVVWHNTYENLGGTLGGRVLLGNNDTMPGHEITGQAYWQTDSNLSSYWERDTTAASTLYPNLGAGVNHTLYKKTATGREVLWRLVNMRQGSLYPKSGNPSANNNYLPWSTTSQPRTESGTMGSTQVSYLIMRNMGGLAYGETPAIYSPCYTNGLGTVYFDVVNGWKADNNAQLIVEVAVQTAFGEPPTDENCANPGVPDDPFYYLSHDTGGKVLDEENDYWLPLKPTVLYKAKGASEFVDAPSAVQGNIIRPAVTTGGGNTEFYRVLAENTSTNSFVRFRIRRPVASDADANQDRLYLILLDNVHASPPAMRADLTALGVSDAMSERTGKQTLGMAGALSTAFPARTDVGVLGRAAITYKTTEGIDCDKTKFIASARFNYRWRYLNQTIGDWQVAYLDHTQLTGENGEILPTVAPLDFTGRTGDIEWYYDMTLQAPAYKYVDYSGCGATKPVGDYSEEIRTVVNAYDLARAGVTRQASGGTNWFVRLRDGKSDWEGFRVEIKNLDERAKPMAGVYEMELVDDNMWRAMVIIPTNTAGGRCSFTFTGVNLHENGDPDRVTADFRLYGAMEAGSDVPIPTSGKITEGGEAATFTVDEAAGYLEFRLSDKFLTYQIGRAEFQDFNSWNDARTTGKFRADSTDTNSVNVADMKTVKAAIDNWTPFAANNDWWNETFYLADYATKPGDRFEKEVLHATHETPQGWAAQSITFVSERFVTAADQARKSGLAGKLRGSGVGKIDFTGKDTATAGLERPEGLEKVTLNARLGQSYSFGSMAYDSSKDDEDNYMFFVPITMSHGTKDSDELPVDMAVGASTSVVGYYDRGYGCYEFRVERLMLGDNGTPKVRLTVNKWYSDGEDQWLCEPLCWRDFTASAWTDERKTNEKVRNYFGLFISLQTEYTDETCTEPTSTKIIAGLSAAAPLATVNATHLVDQWTKFKNLNYKGLVYEDTDEPWGWGSWGVAAKDCPAQFVLPAHKDTPFAGSITEQANPKDDKDKAGEGGKYFDQVIESLGDDADFTDDRLDIFKKRKGWVLQGRYECFTNTATGFKTGVEGWYGIRTPTNIAQTVDLYLKPKGKDESQWKLYGSQPVTSYGFTALPAFNLRLPGAWDMRLRTGTKSTADVVVDDIMQYRWQAPDVNDPNKVDSVDRGSEYVFSQGVVVTNAATKRQWLTLQPARALPTRPVSLRGPILDGLGKFTFDYRNADEKAEVWVQVATNLVSGNLSGDGGYNNSVSSKALGEQQGVGEWLTVAKFSANAANADHRLVVGSPTADSKSVYLGWHNHADRPVKGLFRLFVPPATVVAATNAAAQAGNNDYGKIEVTASSCTDEPGLSPRSWRGWNMRTIGDSTDSEKRMNLVDMLIADGGQGLVAALNNSTANVEDNKGNPVDPDDKRLRSGNPAIYSPTMRPLKPTSGVGSVTVKARLYSTSGSPETSGGGRITVWGAKDSRASVWTELDTFVITTSVFSNYTWTAGREVYTAVKFEVSDASARLPTGDYDRVILDEIVIGEKVPPTINFVYARPFRMDLFSEEPIDDILSPTEQPLAGESWGVQTRLTLQQLTDDIDLERGFEVQLSYFRGTEPWGYGNWCSNSEAKVGIPLRQVGDASNLVFRSVGDSPESLVGPSAVRGEVVQFMLTVKYWDRGGKEGEQTLPVDWRQPDWFYPIDHNLKNGALDNDRNFSAYTLLDTVSPGRAWINEVSWNDGPAEQNKTSEAPKANQFMEICVPAGVDLTGWQVWVTESGEHKRQLMAQLGDAAGKIPAKKDPTANCTNGYEFLVLKAPKATVAEADASWYAFDLGKIVKGGTLLYSDPYQFELVRPSGAIEHQFVLDGTNELSRYSWAAIYDGTNLVHELAEDDLFAFPYEVSPKRFYAGHELARRPGDKLASVGVVGGEDGEDTANWPGGSNTWEEAMAFTPGRINVGQTIPEGWFTVPNGTNSWVYFSVEGGHIRQNLGGATDQTVLVVIPQGQTTNVHYAVDGWYEGAVTENGRLVTSGRIGAFDWPVSPTGSMYYVKATAGPQKALAENFGLTKENPYTPAVLKWLSKWNADGTLTADDIRLARFMGVHSAGDDWSFMDLTDMYWLDIPPVPETPEEWASNDGTNWWFRGGIDSFSGADHIIHRTEIRQGVPVDVAYTNKQITVQLYASNEVTQAVWSPTKLQGLGNESSAGDYGTSWTSVTFKVKGRLNLSAQSPYLPFRTFIFGGESFDADHRAVIDILDPFQSPIGVAYGWDKHPNSSAYFQWRIDTTYYPYSIEKLKADSTYQDGE